MGEEKLHVSAPGRICLFGEHQDYFGLPIIAAAINLRIFVSGTPRKDRVFRINLPDIEEVEEFPLEKELKYTKERDYLKSSINVLQRKDISLPCGWDCTIQGNIPINAGSASSSSLTVAWIRFLLEAGKDERVKKPETIAELAFLSEVAEFKEPGGMMDHYASSLGGVISMHDDGSPTVKRLKNPLKEFVLASSLQKKDTTGMLGYIKKNVLYGVACIRKKRASFSVKSPLTPEVLDEIKKLPEEVGRLLKGTLLTRDLTAKGEALFTSHDFDHEQFGRLLAQQHEILRDYLHISTPKIDRMMEVCLKSGALGAKINGSGGGGCIFAYSPGKAPSVAEALEKIGAKTYIVHVDEGVRSDTQNQTPYPA